MMQDTDYEYEELVGTSPLFNGVNYPYWETDTHKPAPVQNQIMINIISLGHTKVNENMANNQ